MQHFSILDLSAITQGQTAGDALRHTVELAQLADTLGYHRFWLAEHHNMPGIASAATAVVIGHVASATRRIRVGAGGIMLPNHAPLVVAEQFGTLETLYPGRIDLGLGRAPGTDMATARALRRHMAPEDSFVPDVQELLGYLDTSAPDAPVRAIPGDGTHVPVTILGSSLFGAQFAAHLGLPYAFASHFAPAMLDEALHVYRSTFQPSKYLSKPYAIVAAGLCVAGSDEEAEYLRSSQKLGFANLRMGRPGRLPEPVENIQEVLPAAVLAQIEHAMSVSASGAPETVERQLKAILERTQADELIVTGMLYDHAARLTSFRLAAPILAELQTRPQAA